MAVAGSWLRVAAALVWSVIVEVPGVLVEDGRGVAFVEAYSQPREIVSAAGVSQ
jgi:hypothetical protein